ncbi:dNA-directed DNA polymerase III PolC [Prevotella sp. CAG:617]|nr:dNA-directed DNA polymerase III PolC [Prevotella sp. CAG:617]
MNYLFFDTETTGKPKNYDSPAFDTDNWPRLVSFAYILSDETGDIIKKDAFIVKPDGYEIHKDVENVHGISTELANREGIDINDALNIIESLIDEAGILVGHNISFDINVVDCEFYRYREKLYLDNMPYRCTMKESVSYCALPKLKYPKLQDLYTKLFGKQFKDAHNAMADIQATFECFWELVKLGVIDLNVKPQGISKGIADMINGVAKSLDTKMRAKIYAIGMLHSKLCQFEPDCPIERQIDYIEDPWVYTPNVVFALTGYKEEFINDVIEEISQKIPEIFSQGKKLIDKLLIVSAFKIQFYLIGFSVSNEAVRKEVVREYFDLVGRYTEKLFNIIYDGDYSISSENKEKLNGFVGIHDKINSVIGEKIGDFLFNFPNRSKDLTSYIIEAKNLSLNNILYSQLFNEAFTLFTMYYIQMSKIGWALEKEGEIEKIIKAAELLIKYSDSQYDNNQKVIDALKAHAMSNNEGNGNGGGCYIATAVYGSYDCPQVCVLRRFRDNFLAESYLGRVFIKVYYTLSPSFVKWFGHYKEFNWIFKYPLDKFVQYLKNKGVSDSLYND